MSPLHFRKTSDSTTALDMRARRTDIIRPLCEKTLSTGAELAGMRNSLSNSGRNTVKSRNRVLPVQTKSGRKCRSWCRWCSRSCLDGSSVPGSRSAMTCGSGQTMLSWPECFEAEARSSRPRPNFLAWRPRGFNISADTSTLLVPTTRRSTLGDRGFPADAARAWNSLLCHVRDMPSLLALRRELKTVLFRLSYPVDWQL